MIEVEQYARERWDVYGDHFAPFTVMAPDGDRQAAIERAIDRMADVNDRLRRARR
jgi:hypothetical protein